MMRAACSLRSASDWSVIINGSFAPEMSDLARLETGLIIRSMAEALALDEPLLSQGLGPMVPTDDPALALNTALAGDGVVIAVSPGVTIERPIHLIFVRPALRRLQWSRGHWWWSAEGPARP